MPQCCDLGCFDMIRIYALQTENERMLCFPLSLSPQWVWSLVEQCGWGFTPRPSLRALIRASWLTWVGCWSAWHWAWWCCRTTSRGWSSKPCSGSSSVSTPYLFSALSPGTFLLTAYLTYDCLRHHEFLITGKARHYTRPPARPGNGTRCCAYALPLALYCLLFKTAGYLPQEFPIGLICLSPLDPTVPSHRDISLIKWSLQSLLLLVTEVELCWSNYVQPCLLVRM